MPIEISDVSEFQAIQNDLTESYVLVNDIDGSATSDWNDGDGFEKMGSFYGTLDGNGKTVSDITIGPHISHNQGMFHRLYGTIKDVLFSGIVARASVGGAGRHSTLIAEINTSSAIIQRCALVNGVLTGGYVIGGFASRLYHGTIEDCYSIDFDSRYGAFTHNGGIVGLFYSGTVRRCFAAVSPGFPTSFGRGQIFGTSSTETSQDCFWNSETGPSTSGGNATGKTTAEMQDIDTYTDTATAGLDNAWDMVLKSAHDGDVETAVWFIDDGEDYPRLWFEHEGGESPEYAIWRHQPQSALGGGIL